MLLSLLTLSCGELEESYLQCLPDKGIKTARTFADFGSGKPEKHQNVEVMEFNTDGQAIIIRNPKFGSETIREYKNGKLIYIITKQTKLPDSYQYEDLDSLMTTCETQTDTTFVVDYTKDGRPKALKRSDSSSFLFEYTGCEMDVCTLINKRGDTLQQNQVTNKNGVIIESVWFGPSGKKSKGSITKYYDYEYDDFGHWIKRTYKYERTSAITQRRELTYY